MKITPTTKNTNKPAFNGHIVIEMKRLKKEIRPEFINQVRTEIGEGLISMPYKYKKQIVQNECFVGFAKLTEDSPIDEVIIATNMEDYWNKTGESKAKVNQVNNVIYNKISSILAKLGIGDSFERAFIINDERGLTGEIRKNGKELEVILDNHDFLSVHKFKEEKGKFNYDYELQVYDDYDY